MRSEKMKLNKQQLVDILRIMQHNTDTMLEMEEQNFENNKKYMNIEQQLFLEIWKN